MSRWTHNICKSCYKLVFPGREPYTLAIADEEHCCFCGGANSDGIFVRYDPEELHCKGDHSG